MSLDSSLDELQRDALTELLNIGVGRAASGLRAMIGMPVSLSVPAVDVMSHRAAAALIDEREGDEVVAVRQDFSGAFAGRAVLIFPRANGVELVRAVLGPDTPDEEAAAMEKEALAETGNVILSSCLSTMANMLGQTLEVSLPEVMHGYGRDLFVAAEPANQDGLVLFLYINFSVREHDIRGYIGMLMDLPSLTTLKVLVASFIARVMDDDMSG